MQTHIRISKRLLERMAVGDALAAEVAGRARSMVRYMHQHTECRYLVKSQGDRAVIVRWPDGTDMDEVKELLS